MEIEKTYTACLDCKEIVEDTKTITDIGGIRECPYCSSRNLIDELPIDKID